jgi:pectinesterase
MKHRLMTVLYTRIRRRLMASAASLALALCASSTTWATDYVVDPSGKTPGSYQNVTMAMAAVTADTDAGRADRANVFIVPGRYLEQVSVAVPDVSFIGTGDSPDDVVIAFIAPPNLPPTSYGATVMVSDDAPGFMATNLTFENAIPDQNRTQALAFHSRADRTAISDCRFLGYQDTILIDRKARAYFVECFITGDTDFIYGDATAVFDHCTIESTNRGYITAANTAPDTANGLVFLDCTLIPGTDRGILDDGTSAAPNSVFLGRPWQWDRGSRANVVFIRTRMSTHIAKAGWDPWNTTGTSTINPDPGAVTRYSEFGSMDANGDPLPLDRATGLPVGRVVWEKLMTSKQARNYTLANIFGPASFWNEPGRQPAGFAQPGVPYLDHGDSESWDPEAQLDELP